MFIGFVLGMLGVTWISLGFAFHSLQALWYSGILTLAGFAYFFDDVIQHYKNVWTPCHGLDVLLNKIPVYRKITNWVDNHVFKKREEEDNNAPMG